MFAPTGQPTPLAGEPQEMFLQRLLASLIQGNGTMGGPFGGPPPGLGGQLQVPQIMPMLSKPNPLVQPQIAQGPVEAAMPVKPQVAQSPAIPQIKQPMPNVARGPTQPLTYRQRPMLGSDVFGSGQGLGVRMGRR